MVLITRKYASPNLSNQYEKAQTRERTVKELSKTTLSNLAP
jgi:hypothetical protein